MAGGVGSSASTGVGHEHRRYGRQRGRRPSRIPRCTARRSPGCGLQAGPVNPVPDDPVPGQTAARTPGSISELLAAVTSSEAFDASFIHRERMAGLGELTAGIAHELNNPIGYIGSNLNTLRRYVEAV